MKHFHIFHYFYSLWSHIISHHMQTKFEAHRRQREGFSISRSIECKGLKFNRLQMRSFTLSIFNIFSRVRADFYVSCFVSIQRSNFDWRGKCNKKIFTHTWETKLKLSDKLDMISKRMIILSVTRNVYLYVFHKFHIFRTEKIWQF